MFTVYPFRCDDWENIYTLSYHHHQIGSMNYYPLFRVRSWNNCVRCMYFCILMSYVKAWQPRAGNAVDRFWTGCHVDGCRIAKSYRHKHWNKIQTVAIHPQSYCQLVREGIKITGRDNSSWNRAPFFLKISGPLNRTFTVFLNKIRIQVLLKFVPMCPINTGPASVQII